MHIGEIYAIVSAVSMLQVLLIRNRSASSAYKDIVDRPYNRMLVFFAVFCFVDALWGLCLAGDIFATEVFTVVTYGYHFMAALSGFIWMGYMIDYTKSAGKSFLVLNTIKNVFLVLQVLLLVDNYFSKMSFYITPGGEYCTGSNRIALYLLQYAYYFVLILYGLYKFFRDSEKKKSLYVTGIIYSVIMLIFAVGQLLFFDAPMYSLGFVFCALAIYIFNQAVIRDHFIEENFKARSSEQLSIINGLAGGFSTIYSVDLDTGKFSIFNRTDDKSILEKIENSHLDYFKVAVSEGKRIVARDDLERFLLCLDKRFIKKQFEDKAEFNLIIKARLMENKNYKYYEYRFVRPIDESNKMIVGVYDIDKDYRNRLRAEEELKRVREHETELKNTASLLDTKAHRDIMTGLFNRRAFEDHMEDLGGLPDGRDFVYISMDVNGLKAVNDDLGHDAGDELIKGAAFCMKKTLGAYGRIYRHGGDEFSAILHVEHEQLPGVLSSFDNELLEWSGELVKKVTVSYGAVSVEECMPGITIEEMIKISDKRMYEAKAAYYSKNGIDRRGQQDAYEAIRKSYIKILKVDLNNDSFMSVNISEDDRSEDKGFDLILSHWLMEFAESGNVHPDDISNYLEKTNLSKIIESFDRAPYPVSVRYRRKQGEDFINVLLEVVPAKDYSKENRIAFLYVKNIGQEY